MKRALLSPFLVATVFFAAPHISQARDRPLFVAPPLSTFDGTKWGGLVLGQTTFKQVRSLYETGGGAYTQSTELTQNKTSGLHINCLWAKRADEQVLSAIAFWYTGAMPSPEQLERSFDPDAKRGHALYERGRYEDWRVVRFPTGVAAFQLRQGDAYTTPLIVFSAPSSLSRLGEQLIGNETRVEERVDPHAGEAKVGEFGSVDLSFDGKDSDNIPSWVRSDVRNDLRDASAHGTLEYRRGAAGYYNITVSSTRAKNGESGTFSVSTSIEANGPYGTVRATGSGSQRWKTNDKSYLSTPNEAFNRAVREARRDVEDAFEEKMRGSGPPTLEQVREARWSELVSLLRSAENTAPATNGGTVPGF